MSKTSLNYSNILNEVEKEHTISDETTFDINSRVLIVDGL